MQWLFDIVIEQMLAAGFINDWAKARIWQQFLQNIPNSVFTKVRFDSISFQNRVGVDFFNQRLVIQDAGYYLIQGYVTLLILPDQSRMHAGIKVNGTFACYGVTGVSSLATENPTVLCSTVRYLQPADFLGFWVFQTSGGARLTQPADYATWLDCHRLS